MASTPSQTPRPAATLNDHGADRLRAGHPWVYASDLLGWAGEAPVAGEAAAPLAVVAELHDRRGRWLASADYSPHSQIRFRVLTRERGAALDSAFFRARLRRALDYRERLVRDSEACRLISAEADGLPGLIVDRYGSGLAIQTLTWGMAARQPQILKWLETSLPASPTLIAERNDVRVRQLEGLELRSGLLRGADSRLRFKLHGLDWEMDLLAGQKTGGFLDQRENWAAAAMRAAQMRARNALDVFCYQGGFALHLARHCAEVEAVDSSRPALEAALANAERNQLSSITFTEANAFDLLRDYERAGRSFDVVVLDPPAFAKSRSNLQGAVAGYKEINLRALKMLRPGGLLVTCSCSFHVSEIDLLELLAAAAADAHRELIVLERRTQSSDHPILLTMPESYYLKCILAVAR